MARRGKAAPRAQSLYRGLRVTLTQAPDGEFALVGVSVKPQSGSWDDWSLLFPPVRIETREIAGSQDALKLLGEIISGLTEASADYL